MKWILLGVMIICLIVSCATFPKPYGAKNCLVIGAFRVEFPDGYNDHMIDISTHRTYVSGVKLFFRNVSQNHDFIVEVNSDGYYHFLSNGTDEYLLKSFGYARKRNEIIINMLGEINIEIASAPFSLIYLGHSSFIFSNPRKGRKVHTLETNWDRTALLKYVHSKYRKKDPRWLKYNVVESRFEVREEYSGEVYCFRVLLSEQGRLYIDQPGQLHIFD